MNRRRSRGGTLVREPHVVNTNLAITGSTSMLCTFLCPGMLSRKQKADQQVNTEHVLTTDTWWGREEGADDVQAAALQSGPEF